MRKKMLSVLVVLVVAYVALCGAYYVAMRQDPETFSSVMARTPDFAFVVLPFKPMWLNARKGKLSVGQEAPDFSLERYDQPTTVRLSQFRGQKPVVLVFGSYT